MSWRDYVRELVSMLQWWDHDSAVRREADLVREELDTW